MSHNCWCRLMKLLVILYSLKRIFEDLGFFFFLVLGLKPHKKQFIPEDRK